MPGDGRGRLRTAGDGEGPWGTPGGPPGTARVISHEALMDRSEVYEFNSS